MPRQIDAATIAALNSDNLNMATLVQLDFSTPIKMTNWARNVSALSTTFLSSSDLLEIDEVSETSDLQVNSLNITFSGVSQTFVALFLSNDYIDVRARIWKAVLDNSDAIIGAPILTFDGRITGKTSSSRRAEKQIIILNSFSLQATKAFALLLKAQKRLNGVKADGFLGSIFNRCKPIHWRSLLCSGKESSKSSETSER